MEHFGRICKWLVVVMLVVAVVPAPALGARPGTFRDRTESLRPGRADVSPVTAAGSVARAVPTYVPSDVRFPSQWGLTSIGAPTAWDVTLGSSSVVIAVLDTGVDPTHPDLAGRVATGSGYDFVNDDADAADDNGSGTAIASVVAANIDNGDGWVTGVAPGCTIMPVKVLDASRNGTVDDLYEGIVWAVDNGADIITLSPSSASPGPAARLDVELAVEYALDNDVLVVCGAGEASGPNQPPSFPADVFGVIGVGASEPSDQIYSGSRRNTYDADWPLLLGAPGVDIEHAAQGSTYATSTATWLAAPFVSGTLALMRSRWPERSSWDLMDQLLSSAREVDQDGIGGVNPSSEWVTNPMGAGIVDAGVAVARSPELNDFPDTAPFVKAPGKITEALEQGDTYDYWRIKLAKGQVLGLKLVGPAGTDFDLELMLWDTDGDWPMNDGDESYEDTYPELINYTAPVAGTYVIGVSRYAGSGAYTLDLTTKKPVSYLSKPWPRSLATRQVYTGTLTKYRKYQWTGKLQPRHAGGGNAVYLSLKKWQNGGWVHQKRIDAQNFSDPRGYSYTEYRAIFGLPAGRYKLTPVAVEDSLHARTVGTPHYVTVK